MALLLSAAATFTLAWPSGAFAISRADVLARAQSWVDSPVPYSQSKYHDGYRTDCSGFASMVWKLPSSYTTRSMQNVATKILVADLKPGDAMLRYDYHIRIFYGWVDPAHTGKDDPLARYITYEQTGPTTWSSIKSLKSDVDSGYRAYRYKNITNSPAPKNAILNPSFDVWDWKSKYVADKRQAMDPLRQAPIWWSVSGYDPLTTAVHSKKYHKTSNSSLRLLNPSSDPHSVVDVAQAVPAKAGQGYTLAVWAKTDGLASSLKLSMQCLDASGTVLAEQWTPGNIWSIEALAFKQMKLTILTPPGTAKAIVTMRLAGGALPSTSSAGVMAYLDDVSLTETTVSNTSLTLGRSATAVDHGTSVKLSGDLDPDGAAPAAIRIQYKKPGTSAWVTWRYVTSDGDGDYETTWKTSSGTKRGTWSWRTYYGASGTYLGVWSSPVTVHVD